MRPSIRIFGDRRHMGQGPRNSGYLLPMPMVTPHQSAQKKNPKPGYATQVGAGEVCCFTCHLGFYGWAARGWGAEEGRPARPNRKISRNALRKFNVRPPRGCLSTVHPLPTLGLQNAPPNSSAKLRAINKSEKHQR